MENPLVSQLVIHSVIVSFSQSFSLSAGQLVSQSVSQLIRQSASLQSMSQSNQSIEVLILYLWVCVHCKRQKEGQMEIFKTHNVVIDIHIFNWNWISIYLISFTAHLSCKVFTSRLNMEGLLSLLHGQVSVRFLFFWSLFRCWRELYIPAWMGVVLMSPSLERSS